MKLGLGLTALLALAIGLPAPARVPATAVTPVAVAAAGDLRGTLEDLKARFEATHPGVQLQLSFGPSGNLSAQIRQGAPFDLFLSADTAFPEGLVQAGLVSAEGIFPYATGFLTLWVRKDLGLDPVQGGLKVLLDPAIKKIATANPLLAPYGRAGEGALRQAGLYDAVQARLVFADNIAQAAQYLQVGTAEAGLISGSQADHPALRKTGLAWVLPAKAYPPLRQAGVILKRTLCLEQARAFKTFLLGPEGQAILAQHRFGKP